jgi:peptidylprolyl isomerase
LKLPPGPVPLFTARIPVVKVQALWLIELFVSVSPTTTTKGSPFSFQVGAGRVISAWDKGFVGKKVGSRVLLVVPPADGYGTAGSPPKISGTDTLVFVVDLLAAN